MTPRDLADDLLDAVLTASPLSASLLGLPGYDDRLDDLSADAAVRAAERYDAIASAAAAMPVDGLGETDRQTVEFVRHVAATERDSARLGAIEWTVTDLWVAPASALLEFLPRTPLDTPGRRAGHLARLAQVPAYLSDAASRHRDGVAAGRTPVERLVRAAIDHLGRVLDGDLAGLRVPSDDAGFVAERDTLVTDVVRPALEAYRDSLVADVLPSGRDDDHVGLTNLPGGEAIYATLVRQHTSTGLAPDELHDMGLGLVENLVKEYAEVGQRVFATSDQAEIFSHLRDDDELAFDSAEEMLEAARTAIERAEGVAPRWFGTVPSQRCQVEAIPAAAAPGAPPAYYLPPAMDGSRPGTYFLNTHEATQRRRHTAETVAFHEAVPGHHFQLTVAQEQDDLPVVRRVMIDTAFAEGWGLYCERLADEMGLYSGDVARLGMLAADSWRAARLVVDTGLHARGWLRQQAIDWMTENTPLSRLEVATEVDRYIAYPGQALSYMVGRHELLRLRTTTSDRLGEAFDLKAFHDMLLATGGLPLTVLASAVDRWSPDRRA
ncbi:MAG TPA: DUF885 domain-containing protein [Actinomycetales bacterium]|nr:DUF885 domain-containing protein [Actinomycetales bacterium]